jgi:hypothetical protein
VARLHSARTADQKDADLFDRAKLRPTTGRFPSRARALFLPWQ